MSDRCIASSRLPGAQALVSMPWIRANPAGVGIFSISHAACLTMPRRAAPGIEPHDQFAKVVFVEVEVFSVVRILEIGHFSSSNSASIAPAIS